MPVNLRFSNKIGYEGIADLLITCYPGGNLSEAIDQLKKTQNIIIATRAIGDFEGYAVLIFKDAKDLYERVHQIKNLPEIEKVEVSFATPVVMNVPPIIQPSNFFNKDL
jgi:hypothetical protein